MDGPRCLYIEEIDFRGAGSGNVSPKLGRVKVPEEFTATNDCNRAVLANQLLAHLLALSLEATPPGSRHQFIF